MNLLDRGCDGLYAWFMPWPLGDQERSALSELGSRELMQEKDKHYVLARRAADAENQYPVALPVEIAADDRAQHTIPFYLADDVQEGRVSQVLLRIRIVDLVSDDRLEIALNGQSLQGEICRREYGYKVVPYQGMWLIFRFAGGVAAAGGEPLGDCAGGAAGRFGESAESHRCGSRGEVSSTADGVGMRLF